METSEENISGRINKLLNEIQRLEKELSELQESCMHKEFKLDLYKGSILKRCMICKKIVGYPSEEERKDSGYI